MRINNNVNSFNAWTSYTNNQDKLKKSMSRLSTGVISSTDDPAGVGISERMRAQAKGTEMARFNTDNAISMMQTGDSWLQKVNDMLSRMKSLSIEAAGIMSDTDKSNLQVEFKAMQDEISRVTSKDTAAGQFNGLYLFRGGNGTTGFADSSKATGGVPMKSGDIKLNEASTTDQDVIAMAGGGFIVATTDGTQLFDSDGEKVGGENTNVDSGTLNITALATGGFVGNGTATNELQRYDRYGEKVGQVLDLADASITLSNGSRDNIISMKNGKMLVTDGIDVALVDFDATLSADQVQSIVATGTAVSVAAFDDGSFLVEDENTISKYDASGVKVEGFTDVAADAEFTGSIDEIVALNDGGFLAVDLDNQEIQRYDQQGSKVGELITVDSDNIQAGSVKALDDGGWVLAAESNNATTTNTMELYRYSADSSLFETVAMNDGTAAATNIEIAVLEDGNIQTAFTQGGQSYSREFEMTTGINIQIGAELNQTLELDLPNLDVTNYKVIGDYTKTAYNDDGSVASQTLTDVRWNDVVDSNKLNVTSDDVVAKVDAAINFVSKSRASMAAQQNRMQNTKEGLLAYQDNLQAAESKIRDVDMARESTNFSKTQVITNASNAILAQANQLPNSVLQLLG